MEGRTTTNTPRLFSTWFGVFSPTGHVVMAFETDGLAERARQLLLDNGFAQEDVTHYSKNEVTTEMKKSGEHVANAAQIGQEGPKVQKYLTLAKRGCGFLILHAPADEDTRRAVCNRQAFRIEVRGEIQPADPGRNSGRSFTQHSLSGPPQRTHLPYRQFEGKPHDSVGTRISRSVLWNIIGDAALLKNGGAPFMIRQTTS